MDFKQFIKTNYVIFDGAMGSLLNQNLGSLPKYPELLNITNPSLIQDIHYQYLKSGSNTISTHTFQANTLNYSQNQLEDIIKAAIENALNATSKFLEKKYVAFDIGPLTKLMMPAGDLSFEEVYEIYYNIVKIAIKYPIDLFIIETMSCLHTAKACILAIKEQSDLPIICSFTFEENNKTLLGNDVLSIISCLESLKVDGIGINCGNGPQQMLDLAREFNRYSSTPLLVQPNAGLPIIKDNIVFYDITPNQFLDATKLLIEEGFSIIGGCCGTNTEHIKLISSYLKDKELKPKINKNLSMASSGQKTVIFNDSFIKIGERINPSNKLDLIEALNNKDFQYISKLALKQVQEGSQILDINLGLINSNETENMVEVIKNIQAISDIPLQIDSQNYQVIEKALRIYNGKAIINSVNATKDSMDKIFPLAKKYGGMLVCLCIDENGLALSVEKKLEVARKLVDEACKYDIDKNDLLIDCLTLTASANQIDVKATLDAITLIKKELDVKTILGVSNVSYGLVNRQLINNSFISMAIYCGLDAAIIDTSSNINGYIDASNVLINKDLNATNYLSKQTNSNTTTKTSTKDLSLTDCILLGLKDESYQLTISELKNNNPLDIIQNSIIPTLNIIDEQYQQGIIYLPQLIQCAQTINNSFDAINQYSINNNIKLIKKDKILLATIKDDIHDIGKNIVKMILENYGYQVIDLGKDVSTSTIIETIKKEDIKLVGLSALMSSTINNMKDTINEIHHNFSDVKVMIGGAILNEKYAQEINADFYGKDALSAIKIADKYFNK